MRTKTYGKVREAIPAFPRGQSRCQEDLTLSPYAFEKPGTNVAVNSQPRPAFSAKCALRDEAEAIDRKPDIGARMSVAGGGAEVTVAWSEQPVLAITGNS